MSITIILMCYNCETANVYQKKYFHNHQQALVHPISAMIMYDVPCTVLLLHIQGGCIQTGGGAEWTTGYEKKKKHAQRGD